MDDEMESLYAQMEREYEEEELKKKAGKKGGKKGAKGKDEPAKEGGDAAEPATEDSKADDKKAAKKKDKKPAAKEVKTENKQDEKENNKPEVKKDEPKSDGKAADDKKDKKKTETKTDPNATADKNDAAPAESKEDKSKEEAASSGKKGGKDAKAGDKTAAKKKTGVSALKEALEAAKKKEEELLRAEEEKQKREEEARRQKEEQERLERERKQKKKAKEKERIKRQKDEGRYETKEQKEARQRALARLQAMGAKIPGFEEKSAEEQVAAAEEAEAAENKADAAAAAAAAKAKPKYNRLRKKQTTNQTNDEAGGQDEQPQEELTSEQQQQEEAERIKDNWDDDDVKDEWDADDATTTKASSKKDKSASAKSAATTTTTTNNTNAAGGSGGDDDESSEEGGSEASSDEEESDEESENENRDLPPAQRVKLRLQRKHEEAEKQRSVDNLRSPVICVLGHVDTGKTKILDNLRRTRVQEDEAGGITQQIGATNVPLETVTERTKMCRHIYKEKLRIPGLLIIDTPGHESFKSLRSRGSSLCDIAILVIDIMHGLEPQTIESINILKDKKTPFVVALNKIDRLFGWKSSPLNDVVKVIEGQAENVKAEFEKRTSETIVQLAEQGLNAALYYRNPDPKTYISMVPTSAHTSDGIGNLMALIVDFAQTILAKRISYSRELQCTVMEVKEIAGLGTTIDVCLVNGKLKVCDTIIIPGQEGPIVTQIRGLLLPQPNRELRVKNSYRPNKEVMGAQGVKLVGKNLEKAMAGLPLFVAHKDDEIDYFKDEIQVMLRQALSSIRLSDTGVFVQASTLGSLEALLEFLRTSKIPYAGISIGPVHKKDITIASIMLEKDPQYAVILAFDVKVERDAQDLADHLGVKIFTADIIYHLFDKFMGYRDELKAKKREEFKDVAVFPFKLKIMPQFIFNTRDPIICGVKVEAGFVKIGSPVCALCEDPSAEREGKDKFVDLGRITSIEFNHKPLEVAKQGAEVCIRIENTTGGAPKLLGRHFLQSDFLVSKISRDSIDAVKNYFREEMTKSDWQLIIELKKQFQIL